MKVIIVTPIDIWDMSPIKAVISSSEGRNRKAIATPEAKTIAVSASIGNPVLISNSQIKITPKITKGKAPKDTSKPKIRAKATPGKVRCPRGPAVKAILCDSIKVPK